MPKSAKKQFRINRNAKGIRGDFRKDFVGPDNKPYYRKLYRGNETKDGKYMNNVGEYNREKKRWQNGCKKRTISLKHINILKDKDANEYKRKLTSKPIVNKVYNKEGNRKIGRLVFDEGEGTEEASGNCWRTESDHRTSHNKGR